ncbi:hypothetical protein Tco_0450726 [Tanacetum coccineum]
MTDEIRRALCKHNKDNPSLTQKQLQEWVHSNYGLQVSLGDNIDTVKRRKHSRNSRILIKELGSRNAMDVEDVLTHPEENVVAQICYEKTTPEVLTMLRKIRDEITVVGWLVAMVVSVVEWRLSHDEGDDVLLVVDLVVMLMAADIEDGGGSGW